MKPFETWSRLNAVALLSATLLVALFEQPGFLGVAALLSFGVLIAGSRRAWTPQRRFGAANWVTLFRCVTLCGVAFWAHPEPLALLSGAFSAIFILDGVDGWLARRRASVSAFGAHFDMETDAFLVLLLGVQLWLSGGLGAWVLASGLLRYAYVLCLALVPPRSGESPRSSFGRYIFAASVALLVGALVLPGEVRRAAALGGTLAMTLSFVRSFWWSYASGGTEALRERGAAE